MVKPLMYHEEGAEDGCQRTMRPFKSKASTWATTSLLTFDYQMRTHCFVLSILVVLSNGIAEQVLFFSSQPRNQGRRTACRGRSCLPGLQLEHKDAVVSFMVSVCP